MNLQEFRVAYARLTSDGWLSLPEALLLADYASRTEGAIVEVGCYMGRSAMLLAQLPGWRTLYCVDPWEDGFHSELTGEEVYRRFRANMATLDSWRRSILVHRCRIEDWIPVPAGFVYLDGDHTYQGTLAQIDRGLACNPQFLALHDVNDSGGGLEVKRAALERLGPWWERVERLAVWGPLR